MSQVNPTAVVLPATLIEADAANLVGDLKARPREDTIKLDAAAVTGVSPAYLQILTSAFKTFPHLAVVNPSAAFTDAFAEVGLSYPVETDVESEPAHSEEAPAMQQSESTPASQQCDQQPAAAAEQNDQPLAAGAPSKTVLAIDDSRTMRDMLKMTLADAGFNVVVAVDGEDGLTRLAEQPVDLIITDINMPKLDGYGVIRAVRKDAAYDQTPILVLSTEEEQESKDIAKEAGATGWIVKPFDPEGLVKIVSTVCA